MNPYIILAVILALVADGFYFYAKGTNNENTRWIAKYQKDRADAEYAARIKEQANQRITDGIIANQDKRLKETQRSLAVALNSLRDRPNRPAGGSPPAKADCPCGTGAGLCKQDAEFLTREAARGNDLRTGLEACYRYADEVK